MDPLDHPIAEMIGHHVEIVLYCACAKVAVWGPESMIRRIGPGATLRISAARLRCPTCRERPTLVVERTWSTREGRDQRVNPAPLPSWLAELIEGAAAQ